MATYRFEQFNLDIVNPTILVNEDTIQLHVSKNTISVDVILQTDTARLGVNLTDITVQNFNYEGYPNLIARVINRLKDFEVTE